MQEDLHKISVHVRNHNTMYKTVNLEDTTDGTLSSIMCPDSNPFLPTYYILYTGLMVKGRKNNHTKAPFPCKQSWMIHSLNHCQDITVPEKTKLKSSLLPFEEFIMGNGDLSKN